MAGHEHDAVAGHLIGHRNGLLRVAGIIADRERKRIAQDAAGGVDVLDRLLGASLHLRAEGGVLSGHRTRRGDLDLSRGRAGQNPGYGSAGKKKLFHDVSLIT